MSSLLEIVAIVGGEECVLEGGAMVQTLVEDGRRTEWLIVTARVPRWPEDPRGLAYNVAARVLERFPDALQRELLAVRILHGFDIAIATRWKHRDFVSTIAQWESQLERERLIQPEVTESSPTRNTHD